MEQSDRAKTIRAFIDKIPMNKGAGKILVSDWYPITDHSAIPILEQMHDVQIIDYKLRKFHIFNNT